MYKQAKEEFEHAHKFIKFIQDIGGNAELGALSTAKTTWDNVEATIKITIAHEKYITGEIHKLMDIAQSKKHYGAIDFLNGFIKEQIEEEAVAQDLLRSYELNGKKDGMWDHHIKRT